MKRKNLLPIFIVTILLYGCTTHNDDVKIGIIIPMTGGYSDVGSWMKVGIEMAYEDFYHKDSVNLIPIFEDSQGKPNIAIGVYNKLKSTQQISTFISTVSSVCLALKPLIEKDSSLLVVNAGHKDIITNNGGYIFRHALTIPQEALFLSQQISTNNISKISLIYTNNDIGVEFCSTVEDYFKKTGVDINSQAYEENEGNLKNTINKLLVNNPDIVMIYGYTKNFGQVIKDIRLSGYKGRIYANQGFSTPSAIENAGKYGNNVFYSDYDIPETDELISLRARIQKKYGTEISSMNITAYNIYYLLIKSVRSTRSNSPKDNAGYFKKQDVVNILGMDVKVNSNGEIYVPLILKENIYE